jgi:hypothetical protein
LRLDYVFDALKATREEPQTVARLMAALDAALPPELSVVGNASSLLETAHGAEIDRRPTIRFNAAGIVKPKAQGSRWDFVATSNRRVLTHYQHHEPPFHHLIFTPYLDQHGRALAAIGSRRPVLVCPIRLSRQLSWRCRARPTTGMQMLFLLDRLGRRVNLFGFDWKATPTFYDPGRRKDPHDHHRERRLAMDLIERNGWRVFA